MWWGKAGQVLGLGWGVRQPGPSLSEQPLAIPPRPAGCGLGCVTAAWSPRSWPERSSKSSRAPSSRTCSTSSSSVSAPLPRVLHPVLLWGPATPTSSAQRGVSGKGEEVIQGCTVRRDTRTPTHRQMVQSPPLAPTGHLLLSHRAGASLPFQGLSSLLLRIRRVPQRPGFHESC